MAPDIHSYIKKGEFLTRSKLWRVMPKNGAHIAREAKIVPLLISFSNSNILQRDRANKILGWAFETQFHLDALLMNFIVMIDCIDENFAGIQ